MKRMSRRAFIGSAAAVAAGTALGVSASEGIRRHGPVEIRTYFLSTDPIVIEGSLLADARRDLFRIYAQVDPKDSPLVAEMPLSGMRKAVETGSGCILLVMTNGKCTRTERQPVAVKVDRENVTFVFGDIKDAAPVWLPLSDVRRVL